MATSTEPEFVSLFEALVRWTDDGLVAKVRGCEARHTLYEMTSVTHRPCLSSDEELRVPSSTSWMGGPADYALLIDSHQLLERDFRQRMVQGECYLQGVQTKPNLLMAPEGIPGVWAAECNFDFKENTLTVAKRRFVAVKASRRPPAEMHLENAAGGIGPRPTITADNVGTLSDEEVLILLEDHARRVVEGPGARLIPAGKISLMPIIKRKMLQRHKAGVLEDKLVAEARILAGWIAAKAPSHQVPTADSIENSLRNDYKALVAESKGTIGRGQ